MTTVTGSNAGVDGAGSAPPPGRERLLGPTYAATTVGMFALIAFVAFETMAVTTVMPTVATELGGRGLYALSFAAPLASGVIGMTAAGMWSDRRGPVAPLVASMVLFSLGLVVCGLAPSMEVLVVGRVLQGLGGGALSVGLYVMVGLIFPATLQPAVFASFAAAWVLPALFGPALAAFVAQAVGWRWVFVGAVGVVALAAVLIAPALRGRADSGAAEETPVARLVWSVVAASAVLALELLGSRTGLAGLGAVAAGLLVALALARLLPAGTLRAAHGLPAVVATRGLLAAAFFCAEAFIVYVLQENWGATPGQAGLALTGVGVVWALASQVQSRLGARVAHGTAMRTGTALVLAGVALLGVATWLHLPAVLAAASYVLAGAGMGFGYPRTSVAMLAVSTDRDRGANSSALTIADSLGAALALSLSGVLFATASRGSVDPFVVVFGFATALGGLGVVAAGRTRA